MNTLHFEKISKFDRKAEPVTFSIPFAPGRLDDPRRLSVRDGEVALPIQARALASWPDGSVKWLLVHIQPDLPGNAEKRLHFVIAAGPVEAAPTAAVRAVETDGGVRIETGPLALLVPNTGFVPVTDVRLDGEPILGARPFGGFDLRVRGRSLATETCAVELEIEEAGPLRAVVLVRGRHRRDDGTAYLELRGRVTAYAGKSFVEIEHQFLHTEDEDDLLLEALSLAVKPEPSGAARFALGEGHYRTRIQRGEGVGAEPLEMTLDAETVLYQAWEHYTDSFYGDFWADWCGERAGVAVSVYQAHQNFPKALRVDGSGIVCSLYPDSAPPARFLQGMGKTHRLLLHFHRAGEPDEQISARSLQFQLPDRPALARAWYRANNPWVEDFFPEKLPDRLIAFLSYRHDARPQALGMMHFGDAPDDNYTHQGRGHGETVWVNNEYDRPHACALFHGLTGLRRALDSALVCARHWIDVDLCHYSADPLIHGGLKIHTAHHGTGGVTPSHEWVEGLLDFYFLTGRREGLESARLVAENILRHMERPRLRKPGEAAVREGGWALHAMVGMVLGTGEDRWAAEAKRIAGMFVDWRRTFGALLAPYTSHSMPRVPFMISLTVNALARYLLIADDAAVKSLIVETVDDLIEHCIGPDGLFYYKELPSLRQALPTSHVLESLAHAYRITGSEKYLRIATRQFAALAERGGQGGARGVKFLDASGAVIQGTGSGRSFATSYTSILLFAAAAAPLGLLDWFEYPAV